MAVSITSCEAGLYRIMIYDFGPYRIMICVVIVMNGVAAIIANITAAIIAAIHIFFQDWLQRRVGHTLTVSTKFGAPITEVLGCCSHH